MTLLPIKQWKKFFFLYLFPTEKHLKMFLRGLGKQRQMWIEIFEIWHLFNEPSFVVTKTRKQRILSLLPVNSVVAHLKLCHLTEQSVQLCANKLDRGFIGFWWRCENHWLLLKFSFTFLPTVIREEILVLLWLVAIHLPWNALTGTFSVSFCVFCMLFFCSVYLTPWSIR